MIQHSAIMQGTSSSGGNAQAATQQHVCCSVLQQVVGDWQVISQQKHAGFEDPSSMFLQQNSPFRQQQVSVHAQPIGQVSDMHPE